MPPVKMNIQEPHSSLTTTVHTTAGSTTHGSVPEPYSAKLEAQDAQPRRHFLFHWGAFVFSLISLAILIIVMTQFSGPASTSWVFLDVGLGIFFAIEFFTRSGFRWDPVGYARTHLFDFVAMVPALLFLHHGIFAEGLWVWLVLITRSIRAIDRVLGDGFLMHNLLALLEGFEEEITDRVLLRIITRIQADLGRGKFGQSMANTLAKNKTAVLRRVRAEHPHDGLGPKLAHLVGLDTAVEHAEERVYDSIVDILNSPEVDHAIRESIDSTFIVMRTEMGTRTWRKHLGFRHQRHTSQGSEPVSDPPA